MEWYYIKIKPNTATASLKTIQKTFKQLFPLSPYSYTFKNEENRKIMKPKQNGNRSCCLVQF